MRKDGAAERHGVAIEIRNSEELERQCRCIITALEGGMRWRCRKLRTTDRHRLTRHSTPSTIIHVIADNLFRRNRGECTAHSGLVAGNLVNIHVRIKPLAPVSAGRIEGKRRGGDTEGERTRRGGRRAKPRVGDVWPPFNYSLFVTSLPW